MEMLPYQVIGPAGNILLQTHLQFRYSRRTEQIMMESGCRIRINGKQLAKTQIKKEATNG